MRQMENFTFSAFQHEMQLCFSEMGKLEFLLSRRSMLVKYTCSIFEQVFAYYDAITHLCMPLYSCTRFSFLRVLLTHLIIAMDPSESFVVCRFMYRLCKRKRTYVNIFDSCNVSLERCGGEVHH